MVRPLVPPQLELDLWDGQAYVAVVPFTIRNLRPRAVPALPVLSHFAEINVRTYVIADGKPGVYFFSLDAANLSAVLGARLMYGLPYFKSEFRIHNHDHQVHYDSRRLTTRKPAEFRATYRAVSEELSWRPMNEAVERFVSERYCLYAVTSDHLYRTDIHHLPWPLQLASAEIAANTMAETIPLALSGPPPLLHFSTSIDVLVWWPKRVS